MPPPQRLIHLLKEPPESKKVPHLDYERGAREFVANDLKEHGFEPTSMDFPTREAAEILCKNESIDAVVANGWDQIFVMGYIKHLKEALAQTP